MPLLAHLREARNRSLLALVGILAGAIAGWFLYPPVFDAMADPVSSLTGDGRRVALNFSGVATSFDMRIKVSLFLGVILALPWWLYQFWAFITPALSRREKWLAIAFIACATPLFLVGGTIAWVVLPRAVYFLTEFTPAEGVNFIDAQGYLSFIMRLVLGFGVAFTLPVIMVAVTMTGLVSGFTWLRGWRWAVVLIFTFSAMATPTADAITMFALAIPMLGLYFGAVWICHGIDKRRAKRLESDFAAA